MLKRLLIVDQDPFVIDDIRISLGGDFHLEGEEDADTAVVPFGAPFAHHRMPDIVCTGYSDGLAALRAARDAVAMGMPFDAVILDCRLPMGPSGIAVAAQLRLIDPDLPVIFMVCPADPHPAEMSSLLVGGRVYMLEKPLRPMELQQLVLTATERGRGAAAASRPMDVVEQLPFGLILIDAGGRLAGISQAVHRLVPMLEAADLHAGMSYADFCRAVAVHGSFMTAESQGARLPGLSQSGRLCRFADGRTLLFVEHRTSEFCTALLLVDVSDLLAAADAAPADRSSLAEAGPKTRARQSADPDGGRVAAARRNRDEAVDRIREVACRAS